jgi:uncharacterized protein YjbI with pentapeptide repeats
VDLEGASFETSNLFSLDLSNLDLRKVTFISVCYNEKTRWPPNFEKPKNENTSDCRSDRPRVIGTPPTVELGPTSP